MQLSYLSYDPTASSHLAQFGPISTSWLGAEVIFPD